MFCQALKERFYPPGYLHNLLAKWLQLRKISNQLVQGYIDVFYKLCIQLQIRELDEVLIIKFNSSLLLPLKREVDLFENASLNKAFLPAMAIEIKVAPHIRYIPNKTQGDNPSHSHSQPYPSSSSMTNNAVWCNFHKTNSHNSVDCRAIKNSHPHQTLFAKTTPIEFLKQPEVISLTNPTEILEEISHYYALNQDLWRVILSLLIVHLKNGSSRWPVQEIYNA